MMGTSRISARLLTVILTSSLHGFMQPLLVTKQPAVTSRIRTKLKECDGSISSRERFLKSMLLVPITAIIMPNNNNNNNANALSPDEAASQYDRYARSYDKLDGGVASSILGIDEARVAMIRQAKGDVLEIGVGTGLNLDKYDNKLVKSLTLVDISDGMLTEAAERVQTLPNLKGIEIKFLKADATSELFDLFGEENFDTVVDSFSLCVMGNIGALQCLDQLKQVVKRGNHGQILLLENSRSSNQLLGLYQDATAGAAATAGGKGCVYNQNVESLILQTGGLSIQQQSLYAAGLFRLFKCVRT